jgi:beta-mannosidase
VQPRGDRLVVFAINDTDRPWHVATEAVRRSATGDVVSREPVELAVAPDGIASFTLAPTTGARSDVLTVGDVDDDDDGRAWWWFAPDREAPLPTPNLSFDASHDGDDLVVTVTSDVVVRDLAIFPERVRPDATVDRQLVHLLPGEPATFRIRGVAESDLDALTNLPALRHTATLTSLDRPTKA